MIRETHNAPGRWSESRGHRTPAVTTALILAASLIALATVGCKDEQPTTQPSGTVGQPIKAPPGQAVAKGPSAGALQTEFLQRYKLKGRVTLVEFGLIGCELSDKGLKEMIFLNQTKAIEGLAYARVEAAEDESVVAAYYKTKAPGFPIHRDATKSLAAAFDATSYPSFVIVGKFGRVRYRGSWPGEHLLGWAKALLAEESDPGPGVAMLRAVAKLDGPKLLTETNLPDLVGDEKGLAGLLGEKGLLILFVDTTCPYALQAMGEMPTVARTLAQHKVRCVAVNIDGSRDAVKGRFAAPTLGVPLLFDDTSHTKDAWNIQSVPTAVYIDPDKQIAYYGKALWSDVATAVETAAGLPPGTVRFTVKGTKYG